MKNRPWLAAGLWALLAAAAPLHAQEPNGPCPPAPWAEDDSTPYVQDRLSVQVLGGTYFAPTIVGPTTQALDLAPATVRLGWMVNDPHFEGLCRGSLELLLDYSYLTVFHGYGTYFTGPSGIVRYNFVQPDACLVPYVQGGAGFVFNDVWRDKTQHAVGEEFEFILQTGVGVHWLVADNWSLDAEASLIHISNAGLAKHNLGVNAPGASLGLTYFFGGPR